MLTKYALRERYLRPTKGKSHVTYNTESRKRATLLDIKEESLVRDPKIKLAIV